MKNRNLLVDDITSYLRKKNIKNKKMFVTSSFQTQSVVLLHILSTLEFKIPIYFINTGYHFPETLEYKKRLTQMFDLYVINLWPSVSKLQQKNSRGEFLFVSDPDVCCFYNKVQPLEGIVNKYDIWISGVRSDQTKNRGIMQKEMKREDGIIRYHPMLNWSMKMIGEYIVYHKLPQHPLAPFSDDKIFSIGCEPCTQLIGGGLDSCDIRPERWAGLKKTECGLHTRIGVNE